MVVGRTLWDFIIEAFETPGLRIILIAWLILLETVLIIILLSFHNGHMGVKIGYGWLGIELH